MKSWSIEYAPLVSSTVLWMALIVAAILTALFFIRRTRGAALRTAALGSLLLALVNPTLKEQERENLGNIVVVLIDESTSQILEKRPEQAAAIRADLEAKLGKIPGLQVKWVAAAKPGEDATPGTNLFAALNKALANTPPDRLAGVIMITDGQVHDVPKSAAALGFDAPVHALLTGRPDEFDRRIEILKAPKFGIVGQTRDVEFRVVETGRKGAGGTTATVKIRREGRPDENRRVEIGRKVQTQMPFPHTGNNILELDLEFVPGELTAANNRVVVEAQGVRENLRVLLVSGEPHAGERTWRNLLKSDASVDLVHFTILRPPEKVRNSQVPVNELSLIQFPTRELFSEKIREFDLIIFDRYRHRGGPGGDYASIINLYYFTQIASYVEQHGGALLIAAGDDYAGRDSLYGTPIGPVLPASPTGRVLEQPFKARLTLDGLRHPVTQGLAGAGTAKAEPTWGRWFRQVEVEPDRGRTIMNGAEDKPLLVLDRKGKGRVALLTSDHAWLWARGYEGGGPHADLLRRLAHWLMKEPDLEEERLVATAKGLKVTVERRTMDETVGPVTLSAPGGAATTITLDKIETGLWRSTIDVKEPGLYKFTQALLNTAAPPPRPGPLLGAPQGPQQLTAVVHAGVEDVKEMSEVVATDAKLRPLVEQTGGGVFWTRGAGLLGDDSATSVSVPRVSMLSAAKVLSGSDWIGLKDREAFVTRGVKLTPMFTGLMALSALLCLITLAWWREGR